MNKDIDNKCKICGNKKILKNEFILCKKCKLAWCNYENINKQHKLVKGLIDAIQDYIQELKDSKGENITHKIVQKEMDGMALSEYEKRVAEFCDKFEQCRGNLYEEFEGGVPRKDIQERYNIELYKLMELLEEFHELFEVNSFD